MLDVDTRRRIDTARDVLVGKVPDPKSQVEQITIALIYKFMNDMDAGERGVGRRPANSLLASSNSTAGPISCAAASADTRCWAATPRR